MFDYPYLIELLSPKRPSDDRWELLLDRFAERYGKILEAGCGVSIPDNPMGQPRLGALESIERRGLLIDPNKVVMNLNTFHSKKELDGLLRKAAHMNLKIILVIRGDGGPLLTKLDPESIGGEKSVATSTDLIRYINTSYPGQFITGGAFNPYKPMPFEFNRLLQKVDNGAKFVVTQPIVGKDANVDRLLALGLPVVVEAWMSTNIELLYKSVGITRGDRQAAYDPVQNLRLLHKKYPESCVYLSMLGFKQNWESILPRLSASYVFD